MRVDPAFRFGVQPGEKIQAAGDLKQSETSKASAIHTPTNLPPWDHAAQVRMSFRKLCSSVSLEDLDNRTIETFSGAQVVVSHRSE